MKKRIKLSAALISAVLLSGCGSEASSLPDDTPFNCGKFAVMETEKGYYTNTDTANGHILGYWERDTDKYVYLCAKPECTHDGSENCTATYKNLKCINTLLYDDAIYTLAIEDGDNISYSLYKAALDGTSFTKVGDAFSVSNSAGESYRIMNEIYFMIHRGYAYIPYHLTLGDSTFGFAGSGLVKMDIRTGKTETLFSGDDYFSAYPMKEMGVGDYVYYLAGSSTNNDPNEGTYRYNTKTGETDKLANHINSIVMDEEHYYNFGTYDDGSYCIMTLDIDSPSFDGKWENLGGRIRTCLHKKCVRIFVHNFVAYKAKIRRRAAARQGFLTQYAAKFAEKTCAYAYEDRFLYDDNGFHLSISLFLLPHIFRIAPHKVKLGCPYIQRFCLVFVLLPAYVIPLS